MYTRLPHDDDITSFEVSPDSKYILSKAGTYLYIWDIEKLKNIMKFELAPSFTYHFSHENADNIIFRQFEPSKKLISQNKFHISSLSWGIKEPWYAHVPSALSEKIEYLNDHTCLVQDVNKINTYFIKRNNLSINRLCPLSPNTQYC